MNDATTAEVPTLIPTQPGDVVIQTKVAFTDGAILAGDHLVARLADTVDDAKIVIARSPGGEHTVTRAPVRDGFTVVGLVIGVMRSLQ